MRSDEHDTQNPQFPTTPNNKQPTHNFNFQTFFFVSQKKIDIIKFDETHQVFINAPIT